MIYNDDQHDEHQQTCACDNYDIALFFGDKAAALIGGTVLGIRYGLVLVSRRYLMHKAVIYGIFRTYSIAARNDEHTVHWDKFFQFTVYISSMIAESVSADALDTVGYGYGMQLGTLVESFLAYLLESVGEADLVQLRTVCEGTIAYALQSVAEIYLRRLCTARERIVAYLLHRAQIRFFQIMAVCKRIFTYLGDCMRNDQFPERVAGCSCAFADYGQRIAVHSFGKYQFFSRVAVHQNSVVVFPVQHKCHAVYGYYIALGVVQTTGRAFLVLRRGFPLISPGVVFRRT